ncbi:hypothetical protein [Methanosarcina sp. UBA289]|nr:hypothetical protein [Methanosarcina sp. UBA289]
MRKVKEMLILDHPYISEFLKSTAAELQIPVLKNEMAAGLKTDKTE